MANQRVGVVEAVAAPRIALTVLTAPLVLCRFSPSDAIPAWVNNARTFLTVSRTPAELSIVADESAVPSSLNAVRDYRALRIEGPLPLDLVGIFATIAAPLAAAKVPIFPIATYDTDYVLVAQTMLAKAVAALEGAGLRVREEGARAG